jgi:hypothetical protein
LWLQGEQLEDDGLGMVPGGQELKRIRQQGKKELPKRRNK